jgi:hypothetical protein
VRLAERRLCTPAELCLHDGAGPVSQLCSVWAPSTLAASSLGFRDKQGRTLDGFLT